MDQTLRVAVADRGDHAKSLKCGTWHLPQFLGRAKKERRSIGGPVSRARLFPDFFLRRSAGSAGVETHAPGAGVCDAGGVSEFALGYTCQWRPGLQEFPGVLGGWLQLTGPCAVPKNSLNRAFECLDGPRGRGGLLASPRPSGPRALTQRPSLPRAVTSALGGLAYSGRRVDLVQNLKRNPNPRDGTTRDKERAVLLGFVTGHTYPLPPAQRLSAFF